MHRATEPQILFPAFGVLLLGVIWGATFNLVRLERRAVDREAARSASELLDTYEAQIVRAIREINGTLRVVKYAYETQGATEVLARLRPRGLLPPDLVFVVSIADRSGDVVASTRPIGVQNIAGREYFEPQRSGDVFAVSLPRQDPHSGAWTLRFSRRLDAPDGGFAGVAMLAVDADYFVSGYDVAKLGQQGMLGLVGLDGVMRARRVGDVTSSGQVIDYASAVDAAAGEDAPATLAIDSVDGVQRFASARALFDVPLAVMVGLSQAEQLQSATRAARTYYGRAAAASLAAILVVLLFGRMSWQLTESRRRAAEDQMAHARRVEYLAYHDGLTGLANRSLFSRLLRQGIEHSRRHERKLAVLFLDLDRFKSINDTLGHEAGDELLRSVALRVQGCLRASDTVARLGGDEFVVLLPEISEETYVANVAQKVLAAIALPFPLMGQDFRVTGSVGISVYPQDGLDEETLTKQADFAMYRAKELGKNNYQFYSPEMNADSLERLTLESGLRHALERGEFTLHYQAKRDLPSGRISGMEALLRWQHPDLGLVAPLRFIPVAEQTGLIVPIGKWVLKTACEQNVAWQNAGLARLSVAVNLTARQFFDPQLLTDVATALRDSGMAPGLLELEISEGLLMLNAQRTLDILRGLRKLGVRIAVDDFGLGYSTLSTLQQFPIDTIKIDRSFIREVNQVAEGKKLTEAIIAMGRTLSLTVVAQGVETKAQADFLRQHACDELQGFYFNPPVPADGFADLLRAEESVPAPAHD